jgi:DhnA family fructose-bisphosphate aldolase class Ia
MILVGWQTVSRSREQLGYPTGSTAALTSIERAVAVGAVRIMTYLYIGFDDSREEAREVEATLRVAEECERRGLVHLVESRAVRDERNQDGSFRLDLLKLHPRMAAEIGTDVVKTKQPSTVLPSGTTRALGVMSSVAGSTCDAKAERIGEFRMRGRQPW